MSSSKKSIMWSVLAICSVVAFVAVALCWRTSPVWLQIVLACIAGLCYCRAAVWSSATEREFQHGLADKPHRGYDSVQDARVEVTLNREARQRGWIRP